MVDPSSLYTRSTFGHYGNPYAPAILTKGIIHSTEHSGVSTWFHVHCAKASCRPGTKQPGDPLTIEFFQQTNASQHEDYKTDEDRISCSAHVKVARVPQKAKRQEVAFLAQHSLLEPVLECCHFLCKAPQQPKGSVGRLFLGRLDLHKTYFDKFLEHECFAQASHCGFGTKT